MKRRIRTVLDENILIEAKQRATRDNQTLAEFIQTALTTYLHEDIVCDDALRACERFCTHTSSLDIDEIDELLASHSHWQEDS